MSFFTVFVSLKAPSKAPNFSKIQKKILTNKKNIITSGDVALQTCILLSENVDYSD